MLRAKDVAGVEIGDGSCHGEDAAAPEGRKLQALGGAVEETASVERELAMPDQLIRVD